MCLPLDVPVSIFVYFDDFGAFDIFRECEFWVKVEAQIFGKRVCGEEVVACIEFE